MSILKAKNISFTYPQISSVHHATINDISFSLDSGETIGIIGHTGSGKSTLLQTLNGLIKPDSGTIFLHEKDLWDNPKELYQKRFKVGLVFQYPEYQLFEETVRADIAFGPKNMGLDAAEIEERVREAAEIVGLTAQELDKSPFDLSGGQKRRAAIAGVMAMRPEVLVLDEPAAGLDPRGRDIILGAVRDYGKKTGATVICFLFLWTA